MHRVNYDIICSIRIECFFFFNYVRLLTIMCTYMSHYFDFTVEGPSFSITDASCKAGPFTYFVFLWK